VVAELHAAGAAGAAAPVPNGDESAEQKFAREAGARIMQAIALSQFASELHAAGAAAGLRSATSPAAAKSAAGLHSAEGAVNDSARAGAPVPNEDLTT